MEIDQEIFNMMLANSMHQIARIEFRNSKFPYARGCCPLATPARGLCPLDTRQGASPAPSAPWNPRHWLTICPPPLSSGWIRPCSYMPWPRNTSDTKNNDNLTAKAKVTCLWFAIFSNLFKHWLSSGRGCPILKEALKWSTSDTCLGVHLSTWLV